MKSKIFIFSIFAAIMMLAVFLRLWQWPETMHFELDQARDVFVAHDAIHNNSWPLLGPMARGSELFLGPAFYYFQILSGKFFGVTSASVAYPDMLFGLLAVALTFFFLRRYFADVTSLAVSALTASSLYLVTYSSFAWNPNAMFFWGLLLMHGLMLWSEAESKKEEWTGIIVSTLAVGILAQLHFIAFVALPIILVLFFSYTFFAERNLPTWKQSLTGFILLAILASPVLKHEFSSGFSNTKALIETVTDKGGKDDHLLLEKLFRAGQETATYFTTSMISDQHGRDMIKTRTESGWAFICDTSCTERLPWLIGEIIIFVVAIGLFFIAFTWLPRSVWLLTLSWLLGCAVFLVLLAYQISPRFYLFLLPAFVVLWAVLFEVVHNKWGTKVLTVATGLLVVFNVFMVSADKKVAEYSVTEALDAPRDIILARNDRVSLLGLERVADFVAENHTENFIIVGDNRYARALYYLVNIEREHKDALCYVKQGGMPEDAYADQHIFVLSRTKSGTQIPEPLQDSHDVILEKSIGTLSVYKLAPQGDASTGADLPQKCFVR